MPLRRRPHTLIPRRTRLAGLTAAVMTAGLIAPAAASAAATAPAVTAAAAVPVASALRTNSLVDPLGIDGAAPRLSWQVAAQRRGVAQTAYQVRVATSAGALGAPDVWDSGKVESDRSVQVAYGGPALTSGTRYAWSVRVWDDEGTPSSWSAPATFETGLLSPSDWSADWIGAPSAGIGAEWTDYTMTFTASDISGALGVYVRGRDDEHAYMWQLSQAERSLRPHVKNGGYSVLRATAFPTDFDFAARHRYEVQVDGSTITTRVDGEVLDVRTDTTHGAPGVVGFRTSGPERAVVHDVTVRNEAGTVLLDTDFPAGDATFRAGTVGADGLRVAGDAEAWFDTSTAVPLLRKDFSAEGEVVSARVHAAAQGVYELTLNGRPVGDHELAPGWTDYRTRIQSQTYDVTDLVRRGANAFGAEVAPGWFAGNVAMFGPARYGRDTAVVAELHLTYADGSTQVVGTDASWRTTGGPRRSADLLDGERYDARRAAALDGWDEPGFDAASWSPVVVRPDATERLEPQTDQPVRVTQELKARKRTSPSAGTWIYDLGQNMVGKARVTVQGAPGQTVRIRHAEVLNPDGTMYTANFRSAKVTDHYTLASGEPETWSPQFTFHGFRYVEISGVDEAPALGDVLGVVMGTDGELTSTFDSDSALVDQLHSNIVWGQRGNFLSVPTDTPARDERLGWTGDINVFARTGVYNMDSQAFLTKWLQDLRDTQRADGALPGIAPVVPGSFDGGYGPAGWMDAGVNVPWTLWQAYGDTAVIDENYAMMGAYVDYLDRSSRNHIRAVGGYNDWLNLDDDTPVDVLDTAFVAKSARQLSQMAAATGRTQDAAKYAALYDAVRSAFVDAFVAADGTVKGDSQTAYILAITNDLVPADRRAALTAQFVQTLERRDWHLSTGFLGVDGLLPALTAVGRNDIAYRLLQNEDYPSWGYEIGKGATTIWERWNTIMPDGSFGPVEMNSFNHYAYGAVGEWMYRTMAGVSAAAPGYAKSLIAPQPGQGVGAVDFSLQTPYGTVRSDWRTTSDGIVLNATVPGNTTATVRIPATSRWAVTEGGRPAEDVEGVRFVEVRDGAVVLEVASGSYTFATDPVLGDLGEAGDRISRLRALVDELRTSGTLTAEAAAHLQDQLVKLGEETSAARAAHLAGGDGTDARVHRALATTSTLTRWITGQVANRQLDAAAAGRLTALLTEVDQRLSAVSSSATGSAARLEIAGGEVFPGSTFRAQVVLQNGDAGAYNAVTTSLRAPAGWTVAPVGAAPTSVAAGATVRRSYDVTVPVSQAPGDATLSGSAGYRLQSGSATLPVSAVVTVNPAVDIVSATVAPQQLTPGAAGELVTVLRNRGPRPASGAVRVTLPDGWSAPADAAFALAPAEQTTLRTKLTVPLAVTSGSVPVAVSTGPSPAERRTTSVTVAFLNPPALVHDHVDLGVPASEREHGLTASPASGTNVEAGLTRRYTNTTVPGGWFEVDLRVPAGKPFLLRAVETYDQAQLKDYDVLVDGQRVHVRTHRRTEGGQGSVTYSILVDAPGATADGVVRVRLLDTGEGYDPSIADLWTTPVRAGLDVPDLAAEAVVTASSSLEGGGWGAGRLVDGIPYSVAGGSKGYTSNPPQTTTAAEEWVELDLGRTSGLDTVVLYPRTETADDPAGDGASGGHFPRDYRIEVSADRSSWTVATTVTDQPDPGATPQAVRFRATSARYVRLVVTELGRPTLEEGARGLHRLQLSELDVLEVG